METTSSHKTVPCVSLVRELRVVIEVAHYRYPVDNALGGFDGRRGRVRSVVLVVTTLSQGLARWRAYEAMQQRIHEEESRHAQNQKNQRHERTLDAKRAVHHPVDVRCAQRLSPVTQMRHGHRLPAVLQPRYTSYQRRRISRMCQPVDVLDKVDVTLT